MKLCKLNPSWLQEFGPKCSDFHSSLFPNNFLYKFWVLFWLCIKIAVFKNLFIPAERVYSYVPNVIVGFFFHKPVFKNIMYMSSKCDSKYYYIFIFTSQNTIRETYFNFFRYLSLLKDTQGLITQSWNKAVYTTVSQPGHWRHIGTLCNKHHDI